MRDKIRIRQDKMLLTHPRGIAVKFTTGILNSREPTEDMQSAKPGLLLWLDGKWNTNGDFTAYHDIISRCLAL